MKFSLLSVFEGFENWSVTGAATETAEYQGVNENGWTMKVFVTNSWVHIHIYNANREGVGFMSWDGDVVNLIPMVRHLALAVR